MLRSVKSILGSRPGAVAWLVVVATATMSAVALVASSSAPPSFPDPLEQGRLTELTAVISALLGAVIVQRKGNHPVGWLFCLSGLMWAVYHLGMAGATFIAGGREVVAGPLLVWAATWPQFVAFGLAPALVVFLLEERR